MEPHGAAWSRMEPHGAAWSRMEPHGATVLTANTVRATWSRMESESKQQILQEPQENLKKIVEGCMKSQGDL